MKRKTSQLPIGSRPEWVAQLWDQAERAAWAVPCHEQVIRAQHRRITQLEKLILKLSQNPANADIVLSTAFPGTWMRNDFSGGDLFGTAQSFTTNQQRAVVKVLWRQMELGTGPVEPTTIADAIRHAGNRFSMWKIFHPPRQPGNPGWGTVIQRIHRGYMLGPCTALRTAREA